MARQGTTTADRLADYIVGQRAIALSDDVAPHARRALIDWCAATIAGSAMSPTVELSAVLEEEIGTGKSRFLDGRRATVRAAALWNGVASHAAEVDDVYRDAVFHPGSPTIAAALAVAVAEDADAEALLRAVVAGYEISIRAALAIFDTHYAYWHPTGTVGTLAAAVASSSLLGLDRKQTADAISLAATFAAGLQQAFRSESMAKPLHAGRAAEAGVLAARSAQVGIGGARDTLEGRSGFGAAMGGSPDWDVAFSDLGERPRIAEITFKNHCCCGQAFASIDAALGLKSIYGVEAADIDRIRIVTYRTAVEVAGSFSIDGPQEARFSIPYLVAHALSRGSVRLDAAEPPARSNPEVIALMARTEIGVDPEFDRVFPSRRCARVTVETRSGGEYTHAVDTRKGDPDCPLTDDELDRKFIELSSPVVGSGTAASLLTLLRGGDNFASCRLSEIVSEGQRL